MGQTQEDEWFLKHLSVVSCNTKDHTNIYYKRSIATCSNSSSPPGHSQRLVLWISLFFISITTGAMKIYLCFAQPELPTISTLLKPQLLMLVCLYVVFFSYRLGTMAGPTDGLTNLINAAASRPLQPPREERDIPPMPPPNLSAESSLPSNTPQVPIPPLSRSGKKEYHWLISTGSLHSVKSISKESEK